MLNYYSLFKKFVFLVPPEKAHRLAIQAIRFNVFFDYSLSDYFKSYLSQDFFGINFDSPVGLAAGFDKNCELYDSIHKCGFGFAEFGTVTPKPQFGNPQPRLFRLIEDEALINCLGFNNDGIEKFLENAKFSKIKKIPIGINIGPNKDSENFIDDYEKLLKKIFENYFLFDYITVNISSPNTKGLRDLHDNNLLNELLSSLISKKKELSDLQGPNLKDLPIFLKISPDINFDSLEDFLDVVLRFPEIKALIISNTTIDKSSINQEFKDFPGGLSGKPLFEKSTKLLKKIFTMTKGADLKLIGVGGISSAEDAYTKIKSGASLLQFYTAMIYHGPFLANEINRGLIRLLQKDGFNNISEVIGIDAE